MCKPSDTRAPRRSMMAARLLVLLAVPASALAGLETAELREAPAAQAASVAPAAPTAQVAPAAPAAQVAPAAPAHDAKAGGRFNLRCWQYGRLLFEQSLAALPSGGAREAIKLSGTDRYGRPLYVAEIDSATCLIRSAVDVRVPTR